jgi:hypothetical protein
MSIKDVKEQPMTTTELRNEEERRQREEAKRRKREQERAAALDTWLSFSDLQRAGIVPNWPTCLAWQRDPQIAFPPGRLFGPNTRRWSKQTEIDPWLGSRPIVRETAEQAA